MFDTVLGLILFHTAFGLPFAIFLLRNFFIGIPKDLLESARIDGASEIRIFLRLILPLGLPAIASLAIFQFLWTWNDLLVALDLRPRDAADHGRDLLAAARVRRQHRADRAGDVRLAGDPAGRVLRLPALLRAGAARRLGEVDRGARPCAIVGGGLAGFVAYATLRHGGSSRPRSRFSEPIPDPAALGAACARDPPAPDALGERRPLPADHVPGPGRARGARRRARRAAPRDALRSLPPDRRRVPRARGRGARAVRLG